MYMNCSEILKREMSSQPDQMGHKRLPGWEEGVMARAEVCMLE